jgi:hypothetical protein
MVGLPIILRRFLEVRIKVFFPTAKKNTTFFLFASSRSV